MPEQRLAWDKELGGYLTAVDGFNNSQELNKWFIRIRKESKLPARWINELANAVNGKLLKLQKERK